MALPLPQLSPEGKANIDRWLAETVDSHFQTPALFVGATTAESEIYFNCRGDQVYGKPDEGQVDADTTLMLFSMTKFISAIACHIAIDEGKLGLDDPTYVERLAPELWALPILEGYTDDGKEKLKERTRPITLRHLLTHTSGLSYPWNDANVQRWAQEHALPSQFDPNVSIQSICHPLIFEPGSAHRYSVGIDWAAIIASRALGYETDLERLFRERIYGPCGIDASSTSFFPSEPIRARLQAMCAREPAHDGALILAQDSTQPAVTRLADRPMDPSAIGPIFCGGGGLFGTARDYLTVLRHVLKSADPALPAAQRLISPESFKELFVDSVSRESEEDQASIRRGLATMTHHQHIHDPDLGIAADGPGTYCGHSPGLFLYLRQSRHGRQAMSGYWDGAAKTFFWIDPTTGVAGVCCTNLLSVNPDPFNKVFNAYERILYDNLAKA